MKNENEDELKWIKFEVPVPHGRIQVIEKPERPTEELVDVVVPMLPELDNEDWAEAFDEKDRNLSQEIEVYDVSDAQFTRSDVAKIFGAVVKYGCINEADCYGLFQLKDGRYLSVEAWCDTTGWDCQAGTVLTVASSLGTVIEMGVTLAGRRAYLDNILGNIKAMKNGDELIGCLMSDQGWRYELLKPREYKDQEKY